MFGRRDFVALLGVITLVSTARAEQVARMRRVDGHTAVVCEGIHRGAGQDGVD
jgi:hypothetical protein